MFYKVSIMGQQEVFEYLQEGNEWMTTKDIMQRFGDKTTYNIVSRALFRLRKGGFVEYRHKRVGQYLMKEYRVANET